MRTQAKHPLRRRPNPPPPDRFQLLVRCRDEVEQRRLYQMLIAKGLTCRVLVS